MLKRGDVILSKDEYLLVGDVNTIGGLTNEDSLAVEDYELIGNVIDNPSLLNKLGLITAQEDET